MEHVSPPLNKICSNLFQTASYTEFTLNSNPAFVLSISALLGRFLHDFRKSFFLDPTGPWSLPGGSRAPQGPRTRRNQKSGGQNQKAETRKRKPETESEARTRKRKPESGSQNQKVPGRKQKAEARIRKRLNKNRKRKPESESARKKNRKGKPGSESANRIRTPLGSAR